MDQKEETYKKDLYSMEVQTQNERHKAKMMTYNNENYTNGVDYDGRVLDWQKKAFDRQKKVIDKAAGNTESSLFTQYGTLLLGQIEEATASALQIDATNKHALLYARSQRTCLPYVPQAASGVSVTIKGVRVLWGGGCGTVLGHHWGAEAVLPLS